MSYLLRLANRRYWYLQNEDGSDRLGGDAHADNLNDFRTRDNELSFWHIDDQQLNLERTLTALAANRDRIDKIDYILVSPEIFEQAGIPFTPSPGDTPDDGVNEWHWAVNELTAFNIADLVNYAWKSPVTASGRWLPREVEQRIVEALQAGRLQIERLRDSMRRTVEPKL